jgi:IPT/TIG domain
MHRNLAEDARSARSRLATAAVIVALTGLVSGCHHTAAIGPLPGPSCGSLPRPRLTAISPTAGPAGTAVTITGHCFTSATTVRFGGTAASEVKLDRSNKIVATSPPGSGTVPVTVTVRTSKGQRFALVSAVDFTYEPSSGAGSASGGAPT